MKRYILLCLSLCVSMTTLAQTPLSLWEANMTKYGKAHCDRLRTFSGTDADGNPNGLADTYYDAEWVFFQMYDYTKDSQWLQCAQIAEKIYRDGYVIKNGGGVPGYWIFPYGLVADYKRNGDQKSKDAIQMLLNKGSFVQKTSYNDSVQNDVGLSRETAYALMLHLAAVDVGISQNTSRIDQLIELSLSHLNQWFVTKKVPYIRPFMVALTANALIASYDTYKKDQRIVSSLVLAADGIWNTCWKQDSLAFSYTDRETESGGMEPSPDLNLLIAPMYAWLYKQTGDVRFVDRGDLIFQGGAKGAWLIGGKQFDQSYKWSPSYVSWRLLRPGTPSPAGSSPPGTATGSTGLPATSSPTPTKIPASVATVVPTSKPNVISCDQPGASMEKCAIPLLQKILKMLGNVATDVEELHN